MLLQIYNCQLCALYARGAQRSSPIQTGSTEGKFVHPECNRRDRKVHLARPNGVVFTSPCQLLARSL
jgi:hypothetical protein